MIRSSAPLRICDNGGWTDTWFAKYGNVFNIAVKPGIEIDMKVYPRSQNQYRCVIHSDYFGDLLLPRTATGSDDKFHLVEAIINNGGNSDEVDFEITIHSIIPPGSATGSSAATAVALLGAFDLFNGKTIERDAIAHQAHEIETEQLNRQSGIQDQLCSAFGGINFIEMVEYPKASAQQLKLPTKMINTLENQLMLIYLGKAHDSSSLHEEVLKKISSEGPGCGLLSILREAAVESREAVLAGNLNGLGLAMQKNFETQGRLHPDLVSKDAEKIIAIAQRHGALGWKINGAGGDGGSLTLLCGNSDEQNVAMIREMKRVLPTIEEFSVKIDFDGLKVEDVLM